MDILDFFNRERLKRYCDKCKKEILKNSILLASKAKKILNRFKKEKFRLSKTEVRIFTGFMAVSILSLLLYLNIGNEVYKLIIAGQEVGYIAEEKVVKKTLEEIKAEALNKTPSLEIVVDSDALVYESTDLKEKDVALLSKNDLKRGILEAEVIKAKAWVVEVNGNNVVATTTKKEADIILEGVKGYYQTNGAELVSATFKEAVAVTKAAVSVTDIMKPEDAVSLILTGTKEPKIYTVHGGDTLWDIAIANNMSPAEVESANKGIEPEKLKIGQQLNLYQIKPYVTVYIKEIVAKTENIDFETVYENNSTLYKGQVKVKTIGVNGTKKIRTEVTKENGMVLATKELDSVVVVEPKYQIALKGTKSLTTFTGSGSLSSPLNSINISSAYGANRGSGRHSGVDLRNPKGTSIKAADDGVVTFATYSGTYGNIVKLSHGNGMETWYAHANTIDVSVGQVVQKGDVIATVGMTGRTTGYHLHFEVRKNGVPQNPMNYL